MTEAAGPMLVCDGVVKRFGSLAAVDGVSMVVNPGEIVGIGGPNGAGKTTFMEWPALLRGHRARMPV
ncbi:MAG: ATP-binding cassette domain-containing protein, partial [Mesorhizobium sp.]